MDVLSTTYCKMRLEHLPSILLVFLGGIAAADDPEIGGHTKLRLVGQAFPDDSLFRPVAGSSSFDLEGDRGDCKHPPV